MLGDWLLPSRPALLGTKRPGWSWMESKCRLRLREGSTQLSLCVMSPLVGRLLLLVCLALPLYGVEKMRNRGYRKDPDAEKVRESRSEDDFVADMIFLPEVA